MRRKRMLEGNGSLPMHDYSIALIKSHHGFFYYRFTYESYIPKQRRHQETLKHQIYRQETM